MQEVEITPEMVLVAVPTRFTFQTRMKPLPPVDPRGDQIMTGQTTGGVDPPCPQLVTLGAVTDSLQLRVSGRCCWGVLKRAFYSGYPAAEIRNKSKTPSTAMAGYNHRRPAIN